MTIFKTTIRTATLVASLAILGVSGVVAASAAERDVKEFGVSIAGFPVGTARYDATIDGSRYEIEGFMGSTGFFGAFLASRYSGAVIGQLRGDRPQPQAFRGRFEQSRKFAEVDIKYSGNKPTSVKRRPERPVKPYDIQVTSVRNALDPISGLYYLLRDISEKDLCSQNFGVFEGSRTSQIRLSRTNDEDGFAVCNGVYTRLTGFPPEEMAERVNFPFHLKFRQKADGKFEVREFAATTYWGIARAVLKQN